VKDWEFVPTGWMDPGAQTSFPPQTKKWDPAYTGTIVQPAQAALIEYIDQKITERTEARRQKDFKRADEIRAELEKEGITLEDRPDGTTRWKR